MPIFPFYEYGFANNKGGHAHFEMFSTVIRLPGLLSNEAPGDTNAYFTREGVKTKIPKDLLDRLKAYASDEGIISLSLYNHENGHTYDLKIPEDEIEEADEEGLFDEEPFIAADVFERHEFNLAALPPLRTDDPNACL